MAQHMAQRMMLNDNEVNGLNALFGGRVEDVETLFKLCETDASLKDKVETLAFHISDIEDLVSDIHDYLYKLQAKKHETIRDDFSTPYYATPYYDNRTPMGFAVNRNGHVCPYCHTAYMNGYMTCPECHRTL